MSAPKFSRLLVKDLVQRVGTRLSLQVTVDQKEEKVFFEWRGPSGWSEDERVVITESGNTSICDITSLHLKDEGVWTCSAKNKHGVSQTSCNVLTQVPKSYKAPTFLEELEAVLTEQGTVSLECKVVGIPSPTLRWFRDGNEIRSGDVFALQANLSKPVSVYRCDATNCCGTISSESILDISKSLTSKACSAPTLDEPLQDRKIKIGELVELSILVSRMSLPVRVVWWNHGSQIAVGDKYSLVENAGGRYSAIINPVELCDDGVWKVTVDNKYGSVSSECTLTLRVPKNYRKPRFMENLKAVLTKEGLVSFECKVVGYPTPLLRWFKDGAELKPGDVYQLSGSRSLGTYSCLARNCMGEAVSTASLTVEDIGEKFPDTKSDLRFLVPVKDASVKIGDTHRFSTQVTYSPSLEITWRHADQHISNNDKYKLSKEDGGFFHCDILSAIQEDEGEWTCQAKDSHQNISTSCSLVITVPKHYKKPRFLEPLKAVLTEEGAVNLECKVIGVPQPALTWFKDGVELKAGDIHRLMSGKDGSCCLGTYTCVATNCMGSVTSSAALLGFEENVEPEVPEAPRQELMTPDMSDGTIKPFSLSTIQEERTSQMMSPEAVETIRQQSLEQDDIGELSISIGNQEVSLSLYQTPDLSAKDAQNICEMFADELMESISESNVVELPPLRFMKETAKAANISMEAVVIDIDEQDLEDYESLKNALENVDDLKTEADYDDVSICDWVEEPVKVMEYDVITCDAVEEITTNVFNSEILKDTDKIAETEVQIINKKEVKTEEKFMRTDSYNKDSESIPDMEICTADENSKPIYEDKHVDEDDLDLEIEFRRERRKSSYDETLANMDPELLKELGLLPPDQESKEQPESLDLSQLPSETPEDRISRIEAKAQKIIAEDDSINRQRSRSRSRSKSRPPSLDTVQELKTDEIREAKYYEDKNNGFLAQPSLDTIKESPSNVSVAGLLAGGFSSASINQDLQQGPGSPCIGKKETGAKQIEKKIEREENKIEEEDTVSSEIQKDNVTETIEISEIMEEITLTEMHARNENLMDERCAEQEISEKENKKKKKLVDGMDNEVITEVESQDDAFIEAFKVKLTEDAFKTKHENQAKENQEREIITSIDKTSIDTADAIDQLDKSLSISQSKQLVEESTESKFMDDRVKPSEKGPDNVDKGEVPLMKKEDKKNEINKVNSEEYQNEAVKQKAKDPKQLTEGLNSSKLVTAEKNKLEIQSATDTESKSDDDNDISFKKKHEQEIDSATKKKQVDKVTDLATMKKAEDGAEIKTLDIIAKKNEKEKTVGPTNKETKKDAFSEVGMKKSEVKDAAQNKSEDKAIVSTKKELEEEEISVISDKSQIKDSIATEVNKKVGEVSIQKTSKEQESDNEIKNVEAEAEASSATKKTIKNTEQDRATIETKKKTELKDTAKAKKKLEEEREEVIIKEEAEKEAAYVLKTKGEEEVRAAKAKGVEEASSKKEDEKEADAMGKKAEELSSLSENNKVQEEDASTLEKKEEETTDMKNKKGKKAIDVTKKVEEEISAVGVQEEIEKLDVVTGKQSKEEFDAAKQNKEKDDKTPTKKKTEDDSADEKKEGEEATVSSKKTIDDVGSAKKKKEEEAITKEEIDQETTVASKKQDKEDAATAAKKKEEEVTDATENLKEKAAATNKKKEEVAKYDAMKMNEEHKSTIAKKKENKVPASEMKKKEEKEGEVEAAIAKKKADLEATTTNEEETITTATKKEEDAAFENKKEKDEAAVLKRETDEETVHAKREKEEGYLAVEMKKEDEASVFAKKEKDASPTAKLKQEEKSEAFAKEEEKGGSEEKKVEEKAAVTERKVDEEKVVLAAAKKKVDGEASCAAKTKEEEKSVAETIETEEEAIATANKKVEEKAGTLKKGVDEEAGVTMNKKEQDAISPVNKKAEEETTAVAKIKDKEAADDLKNKIEDEDAAAKKTAHEETAAVAKKNGEEAAAKKKKADNEAAATKKKKEDNSIASEKKSDEEAAALNKQADEETTTMKKKKEEDFIASTRKNDEQEAAIKKNEEEAAAAKKKADNEATATKKKKEEDAKKKEEEAATLKKQADEEAAAIKKKKEEDAIASAKKEEVEAATLKKKQEEAAAAKKKADDEAATTIKIKEEDAKKKEEEEAAVLEKQADEEAVALKKKKEENNIACIKKNDEEEATKKKNEEEAAAAKKKADDEAAATIKKKKEDEKKKEEEAATLKKQTDEEAAAIEKKKENDAIAKKKAEEEAVAKKKSDEEAAAKKAEEEAVIKKKADEAADAAKKMEEEKAAAAKKKEDEEAAAVAKKKEEEKAIAAKKKTEEEAAAKKKADDEAAASKKKEEEDAIASAKKKEEDAAAALRKKADEEAMAIKKKKENDAIAKKKAEEETAAKKKADEEAAAKKKSEEEAAAKKKADEEDAARKKKTEEEAAAKKKTEKEAAAKKKADEESAALKKKEEEAAAVLQKKEEEKAAANKKKIEEEAAAKKKTDEEAATKKQKTNDATAAKKKDKEAAEKKKTEEECGRKNEEEGKSKIKVEEGPSKIKENIDDIKKGRKEGKKKTGAKKLSENGTPIKDASESPKRQKKNDSNVANSSDTLTSKNISQSRTISSNIPSQDIMNDVYQEKIKPINSQMPDIGIEYSVDRQRTYQTQDGSMGYSVERQKETHTARDSLQIQEKTSSAYSQPTRDGLQMQDNVSIYSPKPRESTYSHNELNYSSSADQGSYKSDMYKGAMSPASERRFGGNFCVDSDYQDVRLSTASESRSKHHAKEDHFKETVGKSLQTSHNLMSIAQEVVHPKADQQHRVKPPADPRSKKKQQECAKSTLRSKLALEDASGPSVPGGVSEIMIKEVGTNWASLCWKKPSVTRGSPVITYKVEAWLCGEGAFWVEIGRTPIPQFDAFNLKANKCYHFRVTARNRRGWGDSIMTSHKVDLNKPTQMPKIQTDMETVVKCLYKSPVKLSIQVTGEPAPEVVWQRGNLNISSEAGVRAHSDVSGHHLEIDVVDTNTTGKYNVVASNMAGKASKSVTIQAVYNTDVFNAYQQFKRWQSLVAGPLGPFFVNGPRDRRVQCGQSIQLTCRVVGNPWPKTRWFKDTQEIVPDEYTTVYNEGDFQHVNLDDVVTEHSGRYCVEAFNEHGVIKEYFTLIVDNGLDRYMPPFFTKELPDMILHKGCNLLLHCRVESYPYIGVTWHAAGAKVRLKETDYKLIDEDGNVVLVLCNVEDDCAYTCSIINEVAENTTTCAVTVTTDNNKLHAIQDEDVIRHSVTPMFTSWPLNPVVEEGADIHLECQVERCTSLFLSREFLPTSIDVNVVKFSKGSGSSFMTDLRNVGPDQAGLYFITARNSTTETKYPLVIKVKATHNLSNVYDCAIDQSSGPPRVAGVGGEQLFARDGDDAIIKVSLCTGEPPFNISWTLNQQPVVWTNRVVPYNREGCVGIKIAEMGIQDEGVYSCTINNKAGQATKQITVVVDYADHKESELMVELCNCPMLDSLTPLMSWTNTPIGTPRRTPLPNPHLTPLCTPRATPRSTPRTTPRATPQRLFTSRDFRDSYRSVGSSSPGRIIEDVKAPPQRKRFVQAPEIFSSFSSKTVEEGQAVELKCFISCAPLTTTTWEKDGHPIMSGPHTTLTEKTGVRALTVAGVTLNDTGVYKMTITNASGVANCSATLNVKPAKLSRSVGGLSSPLVTRSLYSPYNSSLGGYSSRSSPYNSSLGGYSSSLSRNMRSSSRYL